VRVGAGRFLAFYLAAGMAGSLAHAAVANFLLDRPGQAALDGDADRLRLSRSGCCPLGAALAVPSTALARNTSEEDSMAARFRDRHDAGKRLARELKQYAGRPDVVVLALPRGGVPVAYEVARELGAPLDTFLVRKLGMPGHEELAIGAIASGGVRVLNEDVLRSVPLDEATIARVAAEEQRELERREREYRGDRPLPDVQGRTVILVDDGVATGSTMRAAAVAVKQQEPERLIVAVPVAAPETCDELRNEVDDVVCALTPEPFQAIGLWYEDFAQTTDEEVRELLANARAP
jgi:putative phosphoribosyl transferase